MYNSPNFIENLYLLKRIIIVLICIITHKKTTPKRDGNFRYKKSIVLVHSSTQSNIYIVCCIFYIIHLICNLRNQAAIYIKENFIRSVNTNYVVVRIEVQNVFISNYRLISCVILWLPTDISRHSTIIIINS